MNAGSNQLLHIAASKLGLDIVRDGVQIIQRNFDYFSSKFSLESDFLEDEIRTLHDNWFDDKLTLTSSSSMLSSFSDHKEEETLSSIANHSPRVLASNVKVNVPLTIGVASPKVTSVLGVNMYMVDTSHVMPRDVGLIPFGHNKLPSSFLRLLGDRPGMNSAGGGGGGGVGGIGSGGVGGVLGGVQFHTSTKSLGLAIDKHDFLPACSFAVKFNSVPYFISAPNVPSNNIDNSVNGNSMSKPTGTGQNKVTISNSKQVFFASTLAGGMESQNCGRVFNISLSSVVFEVSSLAL